MTSQGASLQICNNQLAVYLEELKEQKSELDLKIEQIKQEKNTLEFQLAGLSDRLGKVNESLVKKHQMRNEYDRTIQDTEAAYMKILESSQTLLTVLKKDSANLGKRISDS